MLSFNLWAAFAVMSAGSTIAISNFGKEPSSSLIQVLETRQDPIHLPKDEDVVSLRNDLVAAAKIQQREDSEVLKTNGSLTLAWNNAELFS